ncbi:YitT family protein [Salidesulfovibrio onnuriiensis]|uniref:YitT family protein n=1 Tax=Salidesulfovibrio onnuriiensis TaxID=2583823 RepID=UPI0011CC2250|nr:YitT family protein [Salidesulfovibrio onnuriiensis]
MLSPALEERFRKITFGIPWNLFLLTLGSWLIAFSVKAIAVPHGLLTGGMSGLGLLVYYIVGGLTPGQWYFVLNVPVFVLGWVFISKRFFFYSLYGMVVSALFLDMITYTMPIQDVWLAVLACGSILGVGAGLTLRTLGSTGGSDILAVICKEKLNMSIATFEFWFNFLVFVVGFAWLNPHIMLYSIAMTFVTAVAIDYVMRMFGEREMVLIITDYPDAIVQGIFDRLDRGVTLLEGRGGYTGDRRQVVLTMVTSVQLKRLEELVYTVDPEAFTIMGSGFRVLGRGFSSRKVY